MALPVRRAGAKDRTHRGHRLGSVMSEAKSSLDTEGYTVRDAYFGRPYIDRDELRQQPYPHRNVHGGFENTDTRFTFYFPDAGEWGGRMYHPLEGAHAGHEEAFAGAMGAILGGLEMMTKLGGYMVESNSGHIGDDVDPRAGVDPGLYGYRASVESARFSKHIAKPNILAEQASRIDLFLILKLDLQLL